MIDFISISIRIRSSVMIMMMMMMMMILKRTSICSCFRKIIAIHTHIIFSKLLILFYLFF